MKKIFHLIANPTAGKKKSDKNLQVAQETFLSYGASVQTHLTQGVGDATNIARELTQKGATDIIALGGDGTLHEVLNGLHDPTACRLGLIPSGTGNDFAEKIGLPLQADKAVSLIMEDRLQATDYLEVDGVRCMNVAGIGMDVDVLERCQKGKSKGKLKYLKSLVQSLFAYKGIKVEIEADGVKQTRDVLIAAACNGSQFGGGIKICPTADVADGKISAVIVDCIGGKWKIIKAFIQLLKGKILDYSATTHFLCDAVKFMPENKCTVQLDGELYKDLSFDVKLRRGLQFYR